MATANGTAEENGGAPLCRHASSAADLATILQKNHEWARLQVEGDPQYFKRLVNTQVGVGWKRALGIGAGGVHAAQGMRARPAGRGGGGACSRVCGACGRRAPPSLPLPALGI